MYALPRAISANMTSLCLIRQFDNFLEGSAVAYCQAFIEGRPYQFFMVVREQVGGLVVIAVKEGGFAKMEMLFLVYPRESFGLDLLSICSGR